MNAFEYIQELKQVVVNNAKDPSNQNKQLSYKEYCSGLYNTLCVLEKELEMAEYNYEIESVNGEVTTFDEMSFLQKNLNDKVIIFQPVALTEEELTAIDMQSMADVLKKLHDNDIIKENMVIIPPNINIFRAKLAKPTVNNNDDSNDNNEEQNVT